MVMMIKFQITRVDVFTVLGDNRERFNNATLHQYLKIGRGQFLPSTLHPMVRPLYGAEWWSYCWAALWIVVEWL